MKQLIGTAFLIHIQQQHSVAFPSHLEQQFYKCCISLSFAKTAYCSCISYFFCNSFHFLPLSFPARFGHTLVDDVLRGAGTSIPLVGNFFNPRPLFQFQTRPSALLEGLASANAQPADAHLVSALTHNLFKQETEPIGMDLMALNIQVG